MAGLTITVQIQGGEQFASVDAEALVQRVGQKLALALANAVIDRATPAAPVDTGKLAGSGQALPTGDGAIATFTAPYAAEVEQGGPPRLVALDELQGWADRHSIPAFLVQKAIATHGTRAQPFFQPAVQDVAGLAPQMAADAAQSLRAALTGGG